MRHEDFIRQVNSRIAQEEPADSIEVEVVGWVSGQEPDTLDEDWAGDIEVSGSLQGLAISRLLGVQYRVLPKALKKLDSRKVLQLISSMQNKTSVSVYSKSLSAIERFVYYEAVERDLDGAEVEAVEFTENPEYWSASIDPVNERVDFTVEFGAIGRWLGKE